MALTEVVAVARIDRQLADLAARLKAALRAGHIDTACAVQGRIDGLLDQRLTLHRESP